jgi:iron(III) transport system permease protein
MTLTSSHTRSQLWDLGKWRWPITGVLWLSLLLVWLVPITALIATSLHSTWVGVIDPAKMTPTHYVTALTDPALRSAFTNSVIVAVGSATLGTVVVVGLAYYTERTRGQFRGLVDFLSLTPQAVPGIIIGAGLIFASLWIGKLPGVTLYGTLLIIIVGSVIVYLPVSSRIAIGNIVQIHDELEEAARIAGASWLRQMREIFLPLFRNTTIVIWFFLAIHIFQLLSIPWMTYTSDTVVIPIELFQLYMYEPALALVAAISVILILLTTLLVIGLRMVGIRFYELGQR